MTRSDWLEAFVLYLMNLSDADEQEAAYEGEQAAIYQAGQYGEDVSAWQGPEAAAQAVLQEWHALGEVAGTPEEPVEPEPHSDSEAPPDEST